MQDLMLIFLIFHNCKYRLRKDNQLHTAVLNTKKKCSHGMVILSTYRPNKLKSLESVLSKLQVASGEY